MESRAAKTALFEAIAVMGKAFASPRRLELLDLLAQAPRTVDELARASEQSTANTSQHLQALHAAGLVTRAREGTSVRYALAGDEALHLWLAMRATSVARLAEVERAASEYLGEDVEAIDRDELIARLSRGDAVLIDVRPQEEFAAGHIDGGARSRSTSSSDDWPSFPRTARSSRTAVARSAPTRTRRSGSCALPGARRGDWKKAGRNGVLRARARRAREPRKRRGGPMRATAYGLEPVT
jgi:DNA-binding transcriptional ArsR family regulator